MKNTITNIFGLILWGLAIYEIIYTDWSVYEVSSLIIIGSALFLFSNRYLKTLLKSIITKGGSNMVASSTVDPDKPEKPIERG